MRLESLDITNFRIIRRATIEFPDSVIGIIGPNGSGKSSIVEAIAWALYGTQAARSGRDEVKSTFARAVDTCEVNLAFMIGPEHYRIVRRLVGRTERAEVELFRGERSESVGNIETRQYMAQLLGLDWRGFLTSFLARQAELNALSDLQPAKRREHLAGMLGIERLDRAIQQVKEDTRLNHEKAEFIRRQLLEKEQVQKRLTELREHTQELERQRESIRGAFDSEKQRYDDTASRYRQETEKKDACSRLAAAIETEQKTLALLAEQSADLQREHQALSRQQTELEPLRGRLSGYDAVKNEVERLREARSRQEYRKHLVTQLNQHRENLASIHREILAVEKTSEELNEALEKIPADIEQQRATLEQALDKARDEYTRVRGGREAMLSDLAKLRAQIEQIQNIGPETVCDRCHRPFGDDLPKIRGHLDNELRQLVIRLETADREISAIQAVGEKMKSQLAEATAGASRRYELSVKYESLSKRSDELRKRREAASGDIAETDKQLTEAGEIAFDAARFEEATTQLKELDSVKARLDQLVGQLSRLPAVERSILDISEKLAAGQKKVEELTTALAETGFDQERFDKLTGEFNSAQAAVEQQKTRLLEASKELDLELKEIELKEEQMSRFKQAEAELEECATGEYYGEKLGRLFADFRKQLIAGIRPRLAELSSTLFAEMTDGRYSMVELDPDYNLRIMDYGQFFGIDRFSGGEKDLANLCLRLAISQALTESAGLDRSFVILDEVFGSQDEERRELIFHGLVNLKNQFQQVFLITHIDEIKDKVEMLVQVDRTSGGWSEVRVNGQAV